MLFDYKPYANRGFRLDSNVFSGWFPTISLFHDVLAIALMFAYKIEFPWTEEGEREKV